MLPTYIPFPTYTFLLFFLKLWVFSNYQTGTTTYSYTAPSLWNLCQHPRTHKYSSAINLKRSHRKNPSLYQINQYQKIMEDSTLWGRKQTLIGIGLGTALTLLGQFFYAQFLKRKQFKQMKKKQIGDIIGSTPLIYLGKISKVLGCEVFAKVEYLNPFGSSKDRAVKHMLQKIIKKYEENGQKLTQVVQASSGSTAISLIQISKLYGIKTTIFLPDDLAEDKYTYLQILGANIIKVPQVSIVDPNHFFNKARDYAKLHNACFLNQFDNLDNLEVHYQSTGPEIFQQMKERVDAFVCSAGTGGTIAGVSKYLKEASNGRTKVILADPEGSGLHAKIKYGALFTIQEREGYRLKNPFDTVIQGVGLNRPTKNFENAQIDDSFKIKDIEALHMAHYLIQNEGLFVGGSCALNICAVVKYCRNKKGSRVVTVLHDSGNRYLRKFYDSKYLKQKNITFQKKEQYLWNDLQFVE